jgi:uncharacterized RDD family membrane protein YckC
MPPPPAGYGYGEPPVPGMGGARTASMGQRFLARLVDGAVIGIPAVIVVVIVLAVALAGESDTIEAGGEPSGSVLAAYFTSLGAVLALSALYEVGMIATRGATLGKRALGITVVRESDLRVPGWGPAALRWLIPFVGVVVCWVGALLVYLSPLFDNSGRMQGWHDKVAKTLVVTTR